LQAANHPDAISSRNAGYCAKRAGSGRRLECVVNSFKGMAFARGVRLSFAGCPRSARTGTSLPLRVP